MMTGGWGEFTTNISEDAMKVFEQAGHVMGAEYTPFAVATQLVAGTNYRFLCNGKLVVEAEYVPHFLAEIDIFEPLPCEKKEPVLIQIKEYPYDGYGKLNP